MQEFKQFTNDGFGWACRRCSDNAAADLIENTHSRLMREGEGESKQPVLSTPALAKWADESRRTLVCPSCGTSESV